MTSPKFPANLSQGQLWTQLAVQAQSGDKKAYVELLRAIAPFIKARVASGVVNSDWADDITQDVLISVHKSLATYSADRAFRPWLMAIIQFRKIDFLRQHYKNRKHAEIHKNDSEVFLKSVTNQGSAGELKDIEAAMATFPKSQQEIFKLIKIEGYSAKEVAKKMNMSVSAVKVSAHRTTNKLKEMLG